MLYSEIIAVCSEINTKHINTLCGQNLEFVNVKRGGKYSNHWALNGLKAKVVRAGLEHVDVMYRSFMHYRKMRQ
jgi:hypothetical protein